MIDFQSYKEQFERYVVINGYKSHRIGKIEPITTRQNRLILTPFGSLMGIDLDYDGLLVLDYYGLLKASRSWYRAAKIAEEREKRFCHAPVVHFASLTIEIISKLAPQLVIDFADFKRLVLEARGFIKG